MPTSTITSKGQVTIPKEIREAMGIEPGDRVVFRMDASGRVVVEPETVDLLELEGCLVPRRTGVTVEAMNRVVRNRRPPSDRS